MENSIRKLLKKFRAYIELEVFLELTTTELDGASEFEANGGYPKISACMNALENSLNFQLLCFAPPELIKTDISERFPVFWAVEIVETKDERGRVVGNVTYGGRRWRD